MENKIIEYQPVINIGMIGHVSDGKSTITKSLTGVKTQKHSSEKLKNITIRLGYANAKIIKCTVCPDPQSYQSVPSNIFDYKCKLCDNKAILLNHVSFVDCPGHNLFLSTMLNGTSVMDYTILVESCGNKEIPAPQTRLHYNISKQYNLEPVCCILNKIDVTTPNVIKKQIIELQQFVGNDKIIIPMSATFNINSDILCYVLSQLKPIRNNETDNFRMNIIRSFNTNIPGVCISDLNGGVIGGSILYGHIRVGDEVKILP